MVDDEGVRNIRPGPRHGLGVAPLSWKCHNFRILDSNVADPDPYVFGPPGYDSQRYGSGSFYH